MKKFFTLAALLATCWCSSSAAVYTDVFSHATILEKCPEAKTDPTLQNLFSRDVLVVNESLYAMYTSETESGAHYSLINVALFTETNEYYPNLTFGFPYDQYNYDTQEYSGNGIHNVVPPEGKWLKSVKAKRSNSDFSEWTPITFYYSAEPFTFAERYAATVSSKSLSGSMEVSAEIQEPAQYVYVVYNENWIDEITLEWTDEKPVPTVETPTIECWADPVCAGTSVSVKTATLGATIDVKVAINGVEDGETRQFTQMYDWMAAGEFQLPGQTGDVITVTAVATKTDWVNSGVATREFTLAPPPCPGVVINDNPESYNNFFASGKNVKFAVAEKNENGEFVDIEGAKITYSYTWNIWSPEEDSGSSNGETTVDAPYEFTVPTDIPIGAYINFTFKTTAPGYSEGESNSSGEVVSSKIEAPALNVASWTDVEKGSVMTLQMPRFANKLYYTVNDGEEQMTTEIGYQFTVNENMTIVAWATGEGYDDSDKVTYEITVENLTANIDVFQPASDQVEDDKYKQYYFTGTENNGANQYLYYGGFWKHWSNQRMEFYQNQATGTDNNFFANLTAGEYTITGIRVDCPDNNQWGAMAAIYLADEPLVTVDADGTIHRAEYIDLNYPNYELTDRPGYFVISAPNHQNIDPSNALRAGDFNEWIDLEKAQAMQVEAGFTEEDEAELSFLNRKYILIRPWSSNGMNVFRYLIRYNSPTEGVAEINADLDTEAQAVYYNLNGIRVEGKLTPGLYIRVTPASTTKVLVK